MAGKSVVPVPREEQRESERVMGREEGSKEPTRPRGWYLL